MYKLRCASDELPYRFSTGTPAFELIAGLLGTLEYFQWLAGLMGADGDRRDQFAVAYRAMGDHEDGLSARLLQGLNAIPGLNMQGATTMDNRVATFSFTHDKHSPSTIARGLSEAGLFCHWGDNYAMEVARALGLDPVEGVLRLGLAHYNTWEEVDAGLDLIVRALA